MLNYMETCRNEDKKLHDNNLNIAAQIDFDRIKPDVSLLAKQIKTPSLGEKMANAFPNGITLNSKGGEATMSSINNKIVDSFNVIPTQGIGKI